MRINRFLALSVIATVLMPVVASAEASKIEDIQHAILYLSRDIGAGKSSAAEARPHDKRPLYQMVVQGQCTDADKAKCQKNNQTCIDLCFKAFPNDKDRRDACIQGDDGCKGRSKLCYKKAGCPDPED